MLSKIENINIYLEPHIFSSKGHVKIVLGRKIYEYKKFRLNNIEFRNFLLDCHSSPSKFTADGKVYWLFAGSFYKDNENLEEEDVRALIIARKRMQQQRIKRAKTITAGPELSEKLRRGVIPDDTKMLVWQRDRGKCVKCGSQSELQYDHIIPVATGGASSPKNLQILCGKCNRTKSVSVV